MNVNDRLVLLLLVASNFALTIGFRSNLYLQGNKLLLRKSTILKGSIEPSQSDATLQAYPIIEEWMELCEPGLKKATLAMFRACKEIAYRIRTASCDTMACFNEFGKCCHECYEILIDIKS